MGLLHWRIGQLPRSAQSREALAQFGNEQLWLLERGEVTASWDLVPIEKLRISLVAPRLRWREKIPFEDAHRNRQVDGHSGEILGETFIVEARRGCSRVRQPIESNLEQLYGAFEEGFDSQDLIAVRGLLQARGGPPLASRQ